MKNKYIGDKKFYKSVLLIAVPIMIQNGITNFVGLLDNIMIGQVGTQQMTGVAIANQLLFVFNLCIFGAISGAGIFGAQFYGMKDQEGVRNTFRFKILTCLVLTALGIGIFLLFGNEMIGLYLQGEGNAADAGASLYYGRQYMLMMLVGLVPYALAQSYTGTLRETGETILPMKAGIFAVVLNLCLNYVFIFGHFGMPAMGATGAAFATVIARFAELFIVAGNVHSKGEKYPFMKGVYRSMGIPLNLAGKITVRGLPLLMNEGMWAAGMAILNQCYSMRSLDVVAAVNIQSTIGNVFSVFYIAMGSAVGIIVGQTLGAGKIEEAVDTDRKLIVFSVGMSLVLAAALAASSGIFPGLYNTSEKVRTLAGDFMLIAAIIMPFDSFTNAAYFTMRAGGKTFVTFLFDSCFVWVINIPVAYVLSRYTNIPIVPLFFICQSLTILKSIIGLVMVKRGVWIHNLVHSEK